MRIFKYAFLCFTVAAMVILCVPEAKKSSVTLPTTPISEQKTTFNILLLGCDESGERPDSIMILHVDGGKGEIGMLSLPRDSKVEYEGKIHKLNSLVGLGGKGTLRKWVEQNTGVMMDYYIEMKPGAFADVVDALGGLEYTVEQNMRYSDPAQHLYINLKKGKQTLNGAQCEQYCRYRQYVMGDLTRTRQQQKLLIELLRQKKDLKYVGKLPALYHILIAESNTDLDIGDVNAYLPLATRMVQGEIVFQSYDCPGAYNDMEKEGVSYYIIDQGALRYLCTQKFAS